MSMTFIENAISIFNRAIDDYHVEDCVDTPISNPYESGTIENRLYLKCWIDRPCGGPGAEKAHRQVEPGAH